MEIRMEVVSEEEAIEFCKANNLRFVKTYPGRERNQGKLMMLAEDGKYGKRYTEEELIKYYDEEIKHKGKKFESNISVEPDEKRFAIYTVLIVYGQERLMWVADKKKAPGRGTTFNVDCAKLFNAKDANRKAVFMNKNGKYNWMIKDLKGRIK